MKRLRVGVSGWILLCVLCIMAAAQTEQKPKDRESLLKKHNAALQEIARLQQELANAKRALDASPKRTPGSSDDAPATDFFLAGNAYVNLKKYPEAIAAFSRAIKRAPRDAPSFRNRGITYTYLGAYQQALDDLNEALELDPQDAVAYNHRGIAHYALGNTKVAIADFDKAIELQPKLAEAHNNRGIVLHKLGNYQLASKDFNLAAQLGMELAARHLQLLRDEIRQAQERLHQAKMNPGPADGIAGQQTMAALQQFQQARGLPVTGLLDDATKQALGLQPSPPSAPPQASAASPPRFVYQPKPEYPLQARQQGWEGTVTLRLEMLADGTISEVQIVRSSGHPILDAAAQETAKTWTHQPAMQDGVAVTRWADITLSFALSSEPVTKETGE
jgi:TonB family protein